MQRVAIGIRIDRDRLDTHLAGRLDDAAGDFAPVGDENLLEHYFPSPKHDKTAAGGEPRRRFLFIARPGRGRLSILLADFDARVVTEDADRRTGKHCSGAIRSKHFCGHEACTGTDHATLNVVSEAT